MNGLALSRKYLRKTSRKPLLQQYWIAYVVVASRRGGARGVAARAARPLHDGGDLAAFLLRRLGVVVVVQARHGFDGARRRLASQGTGDGAPRPALSISKRVCSLRLAARRSCPIDTASMVRP